MKEKSLKQHFEQTFPEQYIGNKLQWDKSKGWLLRSILYKNPLLSEDSLISEDDFNKLVESAMKAV